MLSAAATAALHGCHALDQASKLKPSTHETLCRDAEERPEKEVAAEIQAIIRQICASVTFLPLLEDRCERPHWTLAACMCLLVVHAALIQQTGSSARRLASERNLLGALFEDVLPFLDLQAASTCLYTPTHPQTFPAPGERLALSGSGCAVLQSKWTKRRCMYLALACRPLLHTQIIQDC